MAFRTLFQYFRGVFKKKIRNYNVIERADKLMDKEKLPTAPRHPTTVKLLPTVTTDEDLQHEILRKNQDLVKRLESMNIESTDVIEESSNSKKGLPQKQLPYDIPDFGYEEPPDIPEGKCTLRQALDFISSNQSDSKNCNIQFIADKYKLKTLDVVNVTKHFKVFEMHCGIDTNTRAMRHNMNTLGIGKISKSLTPVKKITPPLQMERKASES